MRLPADLGSFGVARIDLAEDRISISIDQHQLLGRLGVHGAEDDEPPIILEAPVQRVRRGHELRLVLVGSDPASEPQRRDDKLVALLAEAQQAQALVMNSPGQTITSIAKENGKCRKRLTQLLRLSWLAPDAVGAIVKGVTPAGLTSARLLEAPLPACWSAQREMLAAI